MYAVFQEFGLFDIKQDVNEAMRLLLKISETNLNPEAQFYYALHLYNGFNVEKNLLNAEYYFEKAALNGHPQAQTYYSMLIQNNSPQQSNYYLMLGYDQCDPDAVAISIRNQEFNELNVEILLNLNYSGKFNILAYNLLGEYLK